MSNPEAHYGKFGQNDELAREQLVTLLYRYAKCKDYAMSIRSNVDAFTDDGNVSDLVQTVLARAVCAAFIGGTTDERGSTVLDPQGNDTRAQIAAIIMRFCENMAK